MLTNDFARQDWKIVAVQGKEVPEHLAALRIPPAWVDVHVETDHSAACIATGVDVAGRKQRLYSSTHIATAKSGKFERVRALLVEWEDIRTQIESDLNAKALDPKQREAALVAYLIYETGIRPGSTTDTLAAVQAYGATTLQLRHVKRCNRGVRLRFIGKKGVSQNVLVTNPYLVRVLLQRKHASNHWSDTLFHTSAGLLNKYIAGLGSGDYTAKDFRTARGTSLAMELLSKRKRLPKAKSKRKCILNDALDRVAKMLGNTRAISRNSYVDPEILARFIN